MCGAPSNGLVHARSAHGQASGAPQRPVLAVMREPQRDGLVSEGREKAAVGRICFIGCDERKQQSTGQERLFALSRLGHTKVRRG